MHRSVGMGTAACRAAGGGAVGGARRAGGLGAGAGAGGWRRAGARAGCYTACGKPHVPPRQKCAWMEARWRLVTVRVASGGGGGGAGMRGERVTTDMHRLDHGDRATPHHDVAWMACP